MSSLQRKLKVFPFSNSLNLKSGSQTTKNLTTTIASICSPLPPPQRERERKKRLYGKVSFSPTKKPASLIESPPTCVVNNERKKKAQNAFYRNTPTKPKPCVYKHRLDIRVVEYINRMPWGIWFKRFSYAYYAYVKSPDKKMYMCYMFNAKVWIL